MGGRADIILRLKSWQIVVFTILLAQILTAISNIVLSLLWWGEVSMDLIQIGSIDALLVSMIVAPLLIYIARYSTLLYVEKEILEYEINERKETEQSLRLLVKAVMTTRTGITFSDEKYSIRFTNPADAEMHGYRPEELIGQDVRIFAPPGARKDLTRQQIKEMKTWTREGLNVRRDGTLFPVRLISDVVTDDKGEPIGIITICEDITERKKQEEAVKESVERFRALFNQASDCIFLLDPSGGDDAVIADANIAACRLHGYGKEELIGKPISILDDPEGGKAVPERIKGLMAGDNITFEVMHVRKDGTTFPVEVSARRIYIGGRLYIQAIDRDISERKQAQKAMEDLVKQKDMFITRLGHDLKTPLTPLATLLPLIREQEKDAKLQRLLDVAVLNVNGMKELVVKTLKLARASLASVDEGKIESVPLMMEVDGYVAKRKFIIEKGRLTVRNNIAPGINVAANRFDLEEVFYNLISNAVKYSKESGDITIDASANGRFVNVSVKDSGIGLTAEQITHIFDEFYKVDESRHELDSSGLGLSICRKIVEKHGGRIWAESPGKGLGTTIHFSIRNGG